MTKEHKRFPCPKCGELLGPWSRGITFHAKNVHNLTLQQLWLLKNNLVAPPLCCCKPTCVEPTSWHSWADGFNTFALGHYDPNVRGQNTKKQLAKHHWARGQSKKTNEILRCAGEKISRSLSAGFDSERIKHWAAGHTKETHPSVASHAELMLGKKHHFYDLDTLKRLLLQRLDTRFELITSNDELAIRASNKTCQIQVRCLRCEKSINISAYNVIRKTQQWCDNCDRWSSNFETEVGDFIESLGSQILRRSRVDGREIDVMVPAAKFGIECNGLYWHSDAVQQDKNHHQDKTDACIRSGIRLFHLFEDEWRDRREIVKSMIRSRLGLSERIYARRCTLRDLSTHERRAFFRANHIDSDTRAKFSCGLFHEGMLVAAISLRSPMTVGRNDRLEVARFAVAINKNVVGGLGRLVKRAKAYANEKQVKTLFSYVDMRYGDGHAYESVGFKLERMTAIRFWWTDRIIRYDRTAFKAKPGTPEKLVARANQVNRIYGCSNKVYVLS